MVNTKAKGNRIERKCVDELEENNYRTERPIETKFNRTDFFGLYNKL